MTSIAGVGNLGSDPLQFMRQTTGQGQAVQGGRPPQNAQGTNGIPEPLWEQVEDTAETAGLSSDEMDTLRSDLKAAIASALEQVDPSGGMDAGREAIDSAILNTLQEYGIDTEEIEGRMADMQTRMQAMGPPPGGAPPQGGPPPQGGGGPQGGGAGGGSSALLSSLSSEQDETTSLLSSLFPLIDEEA